MRISICLFRPPSPTSVKCKRSTCKSFNYASSTNHSQHHFFAGLLLKQIELAYESCNPNIRGLLIDTLTDVLLTHDVNPTWSETQHTQMAQIYFPFVNLVIDNFDTVLRSPPDELEKSLVCLLNILKSVSDMALKEYIEKETEKRIFMLFQLLQRAVSEFAWIGSEKVAAKRAQEILPNNYFTVGYVDTLSGIEERLLQLAEKPIKKGKKGKKSKETSSPISSVEASNSHSLDSSNSNVLPQRQIDPERLIKEGANFVREVSLSVLDIVIKFIAHFGGVLERRDVFEAVFAVLLSILKKSQSVTVTTIVFAKFTQLVPLFKRRLFAEANSICGDLVYEVLRRFNMDNITVRNQAVSLYICMLENNKAEMNGLDRTRLQSTIAVTKLVGQTSANNFDRLFDCFDALSNYFKKHNHQIKPVVVMLEEKIRSVIADFQKVSLPCEKCPSRW